MYSIEILHMHLKEFCAVPRLIKICFILEVKMENAIFEKKILFSTLQNIVNTNFSDFLKVSALKQLFLRNSPLKSHHYFFVCVGSLHERSCVFPF